MRRRSACQVDEGCVIACKNVVYDFISGLNIEYAVSEWHSLLSGLLRFKRGLYELKSCFLDKTRVACCGFNRFISVSYDKEFIYAPLYVFDESYSFHGAPQVEMPEEEQILDNEPIEQIDAAINSDLSLGFSFEDALKIVADFCGLDSRVFL